MTLLDRLKKPTPAFWKKVAALKMAYIAMASGLNGYAIWQDVPVVVKSIIASCSVGFYVISSLIEPFLAVEDKKDEQT